MRAVTACSKDQTLGAAGSRSIAPPRRLFRAAQGPVLPRDLHYLCGGYRKRAQPTPNRSIATRFADITLWRLGYRSWQRGEETIFPLELMLGLVENVTQAMLDWIGKTIAAAGMSQQATLEAIKQSSGVSMGVKRLRACTESLASAMKPLREPQQADALLEMLRIAGQNSGSRKPVLCVGRDGITLRHRLGFFEVATAATVSVYDRSGKRLGTIYLAYPPELGQATMDAMLSGLLETLFSRWHGLLPRLAYVTDSGSNETDYFRRVLKPMRHPITGQKLEWTIFIMSASECGQWPMLCLPRAKSGNRLPGPDGC